jgi:hypothetical protein
VFSTNSHQILPTCSNAEALLAIPRPNESPRQPWLVQHAVCQGFGIGEIKSTRCSQDVVATQEVLEIQWFRELAAWLCAASFATSDHG